MQNCLFSCQSLRGIVKKVVNGMGYGVYFNTNYESLGTLSRLFMPQFP